jgi:hypothetical protein
MLFQLYTLHHTYQKITNKSTPLVPTNLTGKTTYLQVDPDILPIQCPHLHLHTNL